jgi:SSS family solute:Na+ symporter
MLVDTPVMLGMTGFEGGYSQGSFLWIINNIYFQYFSVLITIASAAVMILVSHATRAPDYESIRSLTFGTETQQDRVRRRASWDWHDVAASAVVLICITGAYLYFRG